MAGNKKDKANFKIELDELELINAANLELQKLKRIKRQTYNDLNSLKLSNLKTIQRQSKAIQQLDKERLDCENKLATIKDQKTPLSFNKIIIKYHQAFEQMIYQRKELEYAKETLKEKDKNSSNSKHSVVGIGSNGARVKHGEVKSINNQQILDNNKLQYNKVLAANTRFRLQLQEMIKIKEEFLRNLKLLQNERIRNRTRVDRLYEENTALFQQREEYRLKLNLLRERLETTNMQGARDLQEYKRLLNADEKLNSFLEQKNQARLCLQTATDRLGMHAQQGDQLMRQLVEEVEQETFHNLKNSNLKEIVEQYQHNLEQGYILYGLIAQKNVELDHLEDEISNKEKQVENQRSKIRPTVMSQNESPSIPNQEHDASLMNVINLFLLKFQSIINLMEVGTIVITDNSDSSDLMLYDFQKVIAQCKLGCDKLIERSIQLLSAVATITDNRNSRDHLSDFTAMLPITTSRSSNSSN